MFDQLRIPILAAPMAGGPSTPQLVAAVSEAGGFGFLAGGYLSAGQLGEQLTTTWALTEKPFGINVFVPGGPATADIASYESSLDGEARRYGVAPGAARWDDDGYAEKLDLLAAQPVSVVSFTFGAPSAQVVDRLHDVGSSVLVTVTGPEEARLAASVGADALCVQGFEAGGHRAIFADEPTDAAGGETLGLLSAVRLIAATVDLPLVATGGLVHGADVAAVLAGGAVAAQLGSAFLRADEAGTGPTQRTALATGNRPTTVTRAFSGRPARGLRNRFTEAYSAEAPAAYPQLHHLSKPIRAAAAAAGDPEAMSLWAGQTYELTGAGPAAEILSTLDSQLREATARLVRLMGTLEQ